MRTIITTNHGESREICGNSRKTLNQIVTTLFGPTRAPCAKNLENKAFSRTGAAGLGGFTPNMGYPRQVTIHLPRDLPDPSEHPDEFERQAIRAISRYLEMTNGRAFVLFTSHRMLENAARELTPWFARHHIALYAQSDGMPRSKMG
jgi:hypothetical protein